MLILEGNCRNSSLFLQFFDKIVWKSKYYLYLCHVRFKQRTYLRRLTQVKLLIFTTMNTKFKVKTINGEVIVDSINEAVKFFMGYFKEFAEGKDIKMALAVFCSYLITSGKVVPVMA